MAKNTLRAALAQLLSRLTGLDYNVAYDWLTAENSSIPTDPLGILRGNSPYQTGSSGRFGTYASAFDGIRGAAWLIAHGPYAKVRDAIKHGTPAQQRLAIIESPWAGGNYNHGASFPTAGIPGAVAGVDPIYKGTAKSVAKPKAKPAAGGSGSADAAAAAYYGSVIGITTVRAANASACSQVTILKQAYPWQQVIPIPRANIGDPCVQGPDGWSPAIVDPGLLRMVPFLGGDWVNPSDVPGQANAYVAPGVQVGSHFDASQAPGAAASAVPGLDFSGFFKGLPAVMVSATILGTSAVLVLMGVRELLSPETDAIEGNPELLA